MNCLRASRANFLGTTPTLLPAHDVDSHMHAQLHSQLRPQFDNELCTLKHSLPCRIKLNYWLARVTCSADQSVKPKQALEVIITVSFIF